MGNVPNYFSHFIAIALVDVVSSTIYYSWADALREVGDFAAAHPITIGSTTYNTSTTGSTYYDRVQGNKSVSSATATAAQTGWRLPSITDWRYIFEGFGGPKVSDQAGVNGGSETYYGNGKALCNAINTACGNTALTRSNYWTSSEYAGNSENVWYYGFWDGKTDIGRTKVSIKSEQSSHINKCTADCIATLSQREATLSSQRDRHRVTLVSKIVLIFAGRNEKIETMEPKIGDRMKVSPQLTDQADWIDGEVIDVEHNPFMGLVISIKDKLGRIFFGQSRFFVAL